MIGAGYRHEVMPLFFILLDIQGNSQTNERIALLVRVFKYIPKERIINILADRELDEKNGLHASLKKPPPLKSGSNSILSSQIAVS